MVYRDVVGKAPAISLNYNNPNRQGGVPFMRSTAQSKMKPWN
jgi:hypothetical protein